MENGQATLVITFKRLCYGKSQLNFVIIVVSYKPFQPLQMMRRQVYLPMQSRTLNSRRRKAKLQTYSLSTLEIMNQAQLVLDVDGAHARLQK